MGLRGRDGLLHHLRHRPGAALAHDPRRAPARRRCKAARPTAPATTRTLINKRTPTGPAALSIAGDIFIARDNLPSPVFCKKLLIVSKRRMPKGTRTTRKRSKTSSSRIVFPFPQCSIFSDEKIPFQNKTEQRAMPLGANNRNFCENRDMQIVPRASGRRSARRNAGRPESRISC